MKPGPKKRTEPTPLQLDIFARHKRKEPVKSIMAAVGVAQGTVYNALRLCGAELRKFNSLTLEEEEVIIARAATGLESVRQIALDYPHVDQMTVHNMLERRKIAAHPNFARHSIPVDKEQAVIEAVKAGNHIVGGARTDDVAEEVGVSGQTVRRLLKRHGVTLRKGRPRSCTVDEGAFDDPENREANYFTGMLMADGCVHKDRYGDAAVIMGLSKVDEDHLKKFRAFLGSNHTISQTDAKTVLMMDDHFVQREIHTGPCVYFKVRSERLTEALIARGMTSKNSDRCPPPWLEDNVDLFRGLVDGDGWLGESNDKYQYARIGLCGYKAVLGKFRDFMRRRTGADLDINHVNNTDKIFKVETMGETARNAIALLYANDGTVALERKLIHAMAILKRRNH